jgi:hypothetical protein
MKRASLVLLLLPLFVVGVDATETNLPSIIQSRSDRPLLQKSTEVLQTEERARNYDGYGAEIRPRITDDVGGVALRVYFPQAWGKEKHLATQVSLLAESRRLLISADEWKDLMQVYRFFSDLRMYNQQIQILENESSLLKKDLARADQGVAQNQYPLLERARLESVLLDELDSLNKLRNRRIVTRRSLRFLLGESVDLDALAQTAIPPEQPLENLDLLVQKALQNRADYRQMQVQARSLETSGILAQSKNGFRLKYIQPEYSREYSGNKEDRWGVSASFVLPWGQNHLDSEAFLQQRDLLQSEISVSRERIAERLHILSRALTEHASDGFRQDREAASMLCKKLAEELSTMDAEHLEQLRDLTTLRKRMMESRLQALQNKCSKEHLLIDFAEELGGF